VYGHAQFDFVRGVRRAKTAARRPLRSSPARRHDERSRDAGYALSMPRPVLDLQAPWWHMSEAAARATRAVIISHGAAG
jgi:hypothetical protein